MRSGIVLRAGTSVATLSAQVRAALIWNNSATQSSGGFGSRREACGIGRLDQVDKLGSGEAEPRREARLRRLPTETQGALRGVPAMQGLTSRDRHSLMAEGLDGVQVCRAARWEVAEHDADDGGECERDQDDRRVEHEWDFERTRGEACECEAQHDADKATQPP